ncbi:Long-chain-fatty-acid--CoA ligase FadD17 [BD1-7 clade bacterium]|uniref:Long-chain-fatty-acid--CoA ligase FadD17 n=1 Tax=BD1-7 clade bacterium TaxID=2029982 RepID=A0A5S9QSL8_9GAMM|nr:Long-chain-fatty-acid--CoA ligase FadD17 [BD1-7 clade bacterium]
MADQGLIDGKLFVKKVWQTLSTDLVPVLSGLKILLTAKRDQHRSLADFLEKHALQRPENVALKDHQQQLTWRQFNSKANQVAHFFQAKGLKKGDIVALMMENRVEVLIHVAGLAKLGVVVSMINTSQRGDVLKHSLDVAPVTSIIVGSELVAAIQAIEPSLEESVQNNIFEVADSAAGESAGSFTYPDLQAAVADQPVMNLPVTRTLQLKDTLYLVFTSGTTGLPKASRMSHHRFFRAMGGIGLASFRLRTSDVLYTPLPLYHNNALTLAFGAVLGSGATLAIGRKFSASRFWQEIADFHATAFVYIGELCRYLMAQPVSDLERQHHVRVILGNGLRPDIWMEFKQRFGIERINEFYGSSEGNMMFSNLFNMNRTAGMYPLSYKVARYDVEKGELVRNAKGVCENVKRGETGLLLMPVSDRVPFDGYTDKKASSGKMLKGLFKSGDRYIDTGDLVMQQGFGHIAFVDRLGDTFRWKGENVATGEVEAALLKHEAIEHAIVYGVAVPHADGKAGMAAISLKEGADNPSTQDLASYMRDALPPYAVPLFIRMQGDQAVTSTFKYQKYKLKEEGWHDVNADEVYLLEGGADRYKSLTPQLSEQLSAGELRL